MNKNITLLFFSLFSSLGLVVDAVAKADSTNLAHNRSSQSKNFQQTKGLRRFVKPFITGGLVSLLVFLGLVHNFGPNQGPNVPIQDPNVHVQEEKIIKINIEYAYVRPENENDSRLFCFTLPSVNTQHTIGNLKLKIRELFNNSLREDARIRLFIDYKNIFDDEKTLSSYGLGNNGNVSMRIKYSRNTIQIPVSFHDTKFPNDEEKKRIFLFVDGKTTVKDIIGKIVNTTRVITEVPFHNRNDYFTDLTGTEWLQVVIPVTTKPLFPEN